MTHDNKNLRVLVCGGRDMDESEAWNVLERDLKDALGFNLSLWQSEITTLIHGGARGADTGAGNWGKSEGAKILEFKADWKKHGRAAGPIRNRQMLDNGKPDVVVALPGGKGTANMVSQARGRHLPIIELPIGR